MCNIFWVDVVDPNVPLVEFVVSKGGWTSWLKRSTILPSRTRVGTYRRETEARLEFAVSKSMAVKSSMRVSVCLVIDGGSLLTVAGVHAESWGTSLDAPKVGGLHLKRYSGNVSKRKGITW